MSKFVLTAQLQLRAPTNTQQVVNQLRSQLQGQVNIPVSVTGSVQATKQIKQITQQTQQATTAAHNMGKAFGASIKKFAAFNIATRAVGLFASKISSAVDEAIKFERELIKISQVTGKSVQQLGKLTQTITNLATGLGVSSTSLLETSRVLAQAGIKAGDLNVALTALAKTTLAPTFDNIAQTAEGAVAILAQFGEGVGALERQLGAINAVAGQFAVESGDLISVVRRTGGVFKQAGGDLQELIALFTSVRATTRENAESIATGLRTIFTRIQRPATISYLKQLGVELTDLNGRFVGPYEAVRRLSKAFGDLPQGDLRFVQIAEELGGFRQIGKVIPLLQQFATAEEARQAALAGGNSLNKDAEAAQKSLAVQFEKTREKFLALVRDISQTASFQIMIKSLLGIANAFIAMADAIKPILPLITAFAAVKFTRGIGSFVSGIGAGITKKNEGGKIHAFASGGSVPGSGNRDTVPAMLTPGEFVIRKSSVKKIGAGTLAAMNENKYAGGGPVSLDPARLRSSKPYINTSKTTLTKGGGDEFQKEASGNEKANRFNKRDTIDFVERDPIRINVDNLNPNRNDVKDYMAAQSPQDRGKKFEIIAKKEHDLDLASATNSRIDASSKSGRKIYEIKSEQDQLSSAKLGEKMIGAALTPKDPIDEVVKRRLTRQSLSAAKDAVQLGSIGVIQDETGGLGKQRTAKKKKKVAFFGGPIRNYGNGDKVEPLSPSELSRYKSLNSKSGRLSQQESKEKKALGKRFSPGSTGKQKEIDSGRSYGAAYLEKVTSPKGGKSSITFGKKKGKEEVKVNYDLNHAFLDDKDGQKIKQDFVVPKALSAINKTASYLAGLIGENIADSDNIPNLQAITGSIFEAGLSRVSKENLASGGEVDDNRTFDFAGGLKGAAGIFGADGDKLRDVKTDAKVASTSSSVDSVRKKVKTDLEEARESGALKFAKGGSVSDTVPAMLTPGEFVINKKASQSIGYGNLNKMNKQGVVGFAKGGGVGIQKFKDGGTAQAGTVSPGLMGGFGKLEMAMMGLTAVLGGVNAAIENFGDKSLEASNEVAFNTIAAERGAKIATSLVAIWGGLWIAGKQLKSMKGQEELASKLVADANKKEAASSGGDAGSDGGGGGGGAKKPAGAAPAGAAPAGGGSKVDEIRKAGPAKKPAAGGTGGVDESKIQASVKQQEKSSVDKLKSLRKGAQVQKGIMNTQAGIFNDAKKELASGKAGLSNQKALTAGARQNLKVSKEQYESKTRAKKAARDVEKITRGQVAALTKQEAAIQADVNELKSNNSLRAEMVNGTAKSIDAEKRKRTLIKGQLTKTSEISKSQEKSLQENQKQQKYNVAKTNALKKQKAKQEAAAKASSTAKKSTTAELTQTKAEHVQTKSAIQNKKDEIERARKDPNKQIPRGKHAGGKGGQGSVSLGKLEQEMADLQQQEAKLAQSTKVLETREKHLDQTNKKAKSGIASVDKAMAETTASSKGLVKQEKEIRGEMRNTSVTVKKLKADFKDSSGKISILKTQRRALTAEMGKGIEKETKARAILVKKQQALKKTTALHAEDVSWIKRLSTEKAAAIAKYRKAFTVEKTATNDLIRVKSKMTMIMQKGKAAATKYNSAKSKLNRAEKAGARIIDRLFKGENKLTKSRKKGAAAANAAGKKGPAAAAGKEGRRRGGEMAKGALMKGGGIAASVGMIGQQVFGGIAEFQQREADLASRRMDVGGAADASRQASMSESKSKVFTIAGAIEALADPKGFAEREKATADRKAADAAVSTNKALQGDVTKGLTDSSRDEFRDGQGNLNIQKAMRASQRGFSESKAAISQVDDPEIKKQMMREFKTDAVAQTTAMVQSGASEKEIEDFIKNVGGGSAEVQKAMQKAAQSSLALKAAQEELTKANYESLQITSTFNAASVALDNFIGSVDGSSSVLSQNIAMMEAAQSNIGIDGSDAINAIEKELVSTLPDGSPGAELIKSQANQARAVADFNTNLEESLQSVELSANNPGQARQQLSDSIRGAAGGNEQLEKIAQAELAKLSDEQLKNVDITTFIQSIQSGAATLSKGFTESAKTLDKMNKQIVGLTARRKESELQYLAAQKQAIDVQLEAAKIIQEFGGAKVTPQDKKAANIAKFNTSAQAAGVTGLTTGSVEDFARVGNEIQQALSNQIAKGATPGGFGSQKDRVDNDKRKELAAAQKDLITAAKARVGQIREELNIIKKKNALEKSSLEKLVSGDIQGFIEGQAAVGAASAIRMGDTQTAQMFGADAIGAAFKDAQSQGLPPQEMAKFAKASMAAAGVTNPSAVETLSGTSAEEERLREEGRGLGGVIGSTAEQMVEAAQMNVVAQTVILEGAMLKKSDVLDKMSSKMPGSRPDPDKEVEGLYKGGPVYANRGIFVPRGTDTVPAMLTPGEFVVNRASVKRGNNLAILQAMNNGQQAAPGPAMNRGGSVRYYHDGDHVAPGGGGAGVGISAETVTSLNSAFAVFDTAVNKLVGIKLGVKLDPTVVTVNFENTSFLATLRDSVRDEVLAQVKNQMPNVGLNLSGDNTYDPDAVV